MDPFLLLFSAINIKKKQLSKCCKFINIISITFNMFANKIV